MRNFSTQTSPWLTPGDAEVLRLYHETDPEGARLYENHLHQEARSNDRFYGRQVRCEPDGVVALSATEDFKVGPLLG